MLITMLTGGENVTDPRQTERWIVRIGEGDRDALAALYEHTHTALYAYALSMVRHTEDAQDVLHDCYMAVVRHAAAYRSEGKPMAWMYTIARHLSVQKLRDRAKTGSHAEDWLESAGTVESFSADDRLVLTACMQQLSDEERQIVILYAVSGLRHREIAALMHLPLSTVLSKYHRSLKKLRNALEGGECL